MSKYSPRGGHATLPLRDGAIFPVHQDKAILVTGAAGGVGRATAELLAAQGARLVLIDLDATALGSLAGTLGAPGHHLAIAMDLASEASVSDGFARAVEGFGTLHALVNCAAIVRHSEPLDIPRSDWERQFAVNLFGAYDIARLTARHMIDRGVRGALVAIASEAGKKGHVESLAYSASKAGVISMTRMLSEALAPFDINVNCICPGGVATPMLREVAEAYSGYSGEAAPAIFDKMINTQLIRHIEPVEVARIASFLLTDDAMLIRGQAINADGGETPY
ncbi:SDR family NAD(P)-dependent oxidoreductase [Rhizobium rhizosphaerae]|uniref:SDR family NAD(P)-dependent oxidoreductase n=1 Tax=Xaviernesmea rhizosphaerae TaxID=1672749 RepID=UPI000B1083FA|nr:SDR family oxidoreductase [Xaviernesmea rhizosphaerae]